jgi:hypothetical protein
VNPALRQILLGGYCQEAQNAFAAMTVPPSTNLKRLYDRCIRSLKAAGIWSKLDALYLMNVETAQAARLNIKNPGTFDLTATSSPTFTAKVGYAGDGAAAFLNTNFNPTTATSPNYAQNSASVFAWALKQGTDLGAGIGQTSVNANSYTFPNFTDGNAYGRANNATAMSVATSDGRGLLHANRSASGATQLYKNGASVATGSEASSAPDNSNISILRSHTRFYSAGVAMAGFGASLSAQNAADLYTALNAFKTGVDAL